METEPQTLAMFDQDLDKMVNKRDLTSKVGFWHKTIDKR
jgi:hypothetical protein